MKICIESNELLLALLFLTLFTFAAAKMGKIEISKFLSKLKGIIIFYLLSKFLLDNWTLFGVSYLEEEAKAYFSHFRE